MEIPNEMLEYSMQHRYAGNGWGVARAREDDWYDIIFLGKINPGSQIFAVWNKCLSLEKLRENHGTAMEPRWVTTDKNVPIHHTQMDKIKAIRNKLSSGEYVVKNTRLEKVAA